jgi:hypothetical protein
MSLKETQDKLKELSRCVAEPIPPHLGEKIRRTIPVRLQNRWGKDAVNIIIHFRISRFTAAIAILLTLVVCWTLFDGSKGDTPLYRELIRLDWLPGKDAGYTTVRSALETRYRWLVEQGYEAEYYGDIISFESADDIILYWRIDDEHYRVIFANLKPRIVTAKELVHLQSSMLKSRAGAN